MTIKQAARTNALTLLLSLCPMTGCGSPHQSSDAPAIARFDSAKAAGHTANLVFGPIWPHDSACFVWVDSQVRAHRFHSTDDEAAAEAFAHCTDTAELEARKRPVTAERRATIEARRNMGLPPLPQVSLDTNPQADSR